MSRLKRDAWLRDWRLFSTGRPHWSQDTPLATGSALCPKTEMPSCPLFNHISAHTNGPTCISMVRRCIQTHTQTLKTLFSLHHNLIGPMIPLTPPSRNKYKTRINLSLNVRPFGLFRMTRWNYTTIHWEYIIKHLWTFPFMDSVDMLLTVFSSSMDSLLGGECWWFVCALNRFYYLAMLCATRLSSFLFYSTEDLFSLSQTERESPQCICFRVTDIYRQESRQKWYCS